MRQRLSPQSRFDVEERIATRLGGDGDSVARGLFEDRVFGAYARLNEERRGILEW